VGVNCRCWECEPFQDHIPEEDPRSNTEGYALSDTTVRWLVQVSTGGFETKWPARKGYRTAGSDNLAVGCIAIAPAGNEILDSTPRMDGTRQEAWFGPMVG